MHDEKFKVLVTLFISLMIVSFILTSTIRLWFPTSGQHTGIVTAVEHNQYLISSANLVYFKTSEYTTQEDVYCVNDENLLQNLKGYQQNRTLITIFFKNDAFTTIWACDGGISIIYKVQR